MDMEVVNVYFNGNILTLFKPVAERFNLKEGTQIKTDTLFWEVLGANARHGILDCNIKAYQQN